MGALLTDLYQLTMAAGYFHGGMAGRTATCELFVRRLPRARRYLVAMGIEAAVDWLASLRFEEDDIRFLRTVPALAGAMTSELQDYLRAFRFTGDVWAMPEGTVFFQNEPILRVTAPLIEAQMVETFLLSRINHATMIASKATRVVRAAGGAAVVEFGTRRTHPDAAVDAARAAYAVGFAATSNVEAARRFGIPVTGTAAHMWTMAHDSEEQAFEAYVRTFPGSCILLIDTYDTLRGAERAARIARERLRGVRLDSGDLGALSVQVRRILDAAGCSSAKIVATGDLNEHSIAKLVLEQAPIDTYGVGTELVASVDAPALGGVYKLVEIEHDGQVVPIAKLSHAKATYAGRHQVVRYRDERGRLVRDVLALDDEVGAGQALPDRGRPLLVQMLSRGKRARDADPLDVVRARVRAELDGLPEAFHQLDDASPAPAVVEPSAALLRLTAEVARRVGTGEREGSR